MKHRDRILRVVRKRNGGPRSRAVLEGLARGRREQCAAPLLIDYMIAFGELVPHGGPRNRTYGLRGRG